jgi:hypothetical protein
VSEDVFVDRHTVRLRASWHSSKRDVTGRPPVAAGERHAHVQRASGSSAVYRTKTAVRLFKLGTA